MQLDMEKWENCYGDSMYKEKLKEIRENQKIKQKSLAEILEIDQSVYSHYETEYNIMPIIHLITIADYFNVSLDFLFSFTNTRKYANSKTGVEKIEAGKRLKEFRKENKLTQVKLASILNTTQSVIADYERGRYLIATPFLYTICKKYNISADYLLGKIECPKYLK